MNIAATKIEALLSADTALQAMVNGAHYWELAPEKQTMPFITFRITENTQATKDRTGDYDVSIFCFNSTLKGASDISDAVKTALEGFNYRGATSGYNDSEAREGFIQLNFNFKIRT